MADAMHDGAPAVPVMSRAVRASLVGLVLAVPGLTYWIIGDLTEPGAERAADRVWQEPVSERAASVIGIACLLVVVAGIAVVISSRHAGMLRTDGWSVGLMVAAGIIVAAGIRVMTARVGGANIGAGLFVLFGFPLSAILVAAAVAILWRHRRTS